MEEGEQGLLLDPCHPRSLVQVKESEKNVAANFYVFFLLPAHLQHMICKQLIFCDGVLHIPFQLISGDIKHGRKKGYEF